jgi:ubiquinone/menaquinone biosynthesis C-methylase UbiE
MLPHRGVVRHDSDPFFSQESDDAKLMPDAKIHKEQVPEVYARIAPIYDLWARLTETVARDRCLELAAIRDGEDVLEVAVGTGLAFAKILEANPSGRNEGIDLAPAMLMRAERRAARTGLDCYHLRVGDAYDLPFAGDSFDVVLNNYMFDLIPERDFLAVLEEFKRVLRPGGRLVTINMAQGKHWYDRVWGHLYRISPALLGGCRPISLLPALRQCGLRVTANEHISQNTFPSEVVVALAT